MLSVCTLGQAVHMTFAPVLPRHTDCRDLENPEDIHRKIPGGCMLCSPSHLDFLPLSCLTLLPNIRSRQTFPSDGPQGKFLSKKESLGVGTWAQLVNCFLGTPAGSRFAAFPGPFPGNVHSERIFPATSPRVSKQACSSLSFHFLFMLIIWYRISSTAG